jgi:protein-S-isoprenylcysteine O-methyltransferase Ste14
MKKEQSLWGPAIGTLAFVLILPGTLIVGVPYLLTDWAMGAPFLNLRFTRWIGALLFLAALPLFLQFLVRFVAEGRGTPAPVAPTERLVVGGPFRWVRNPGYIAVLGLVVGEGVFLAHTSVLVYAASLAVAFHLFVLLYEEPTLQRQFGTEYEQYCRRVPRWIPRRPGDGREH